MNPKRHLIVSLALSFFLGLGVIIAIFITLTPRSVSYAPLVEEGPTLSSQGAELQTASGVQKVPLPLAEAPLLGGLPLPLSETLFSISANGDVDSDFEADLYADLEVFGVDPENIPVENTLQVSPTTVTSNFEYMEFISAGNPRTCVFVGPGGRGEGRGSGTLLRILAENSNLRTRQTGIFLFSRTDSPPAEGAQSVAGFLLNNVWLRARESTEIVVLLEQTLVGGVLVVRDLDSNGGVFSV